MRLSQREKDRYDRQILLEKVGHEGQLKLKSARVLVVGAGGLGCAVLPYLAAAGIGTLGVIDFDKVEESNLQRQILFDSSMVGVNKAIAAQERLSSLNPLIEMKAYSEKLGKDNARETLGGYDLIVDGSDNLATRYLVNDVCILLGIPFVYGSIYRFEGQVAVFNYRNGPSYRCLFPEQASSERVPTCSDSGVLGVLPGMVGLKQVNEVLKMILGIGEVLSGKLMHLNALSNKVSLMHIPRSKSRDELIGEAQELFSKSTYEHICTNTHLDAEIIEISVGALRHKIEMGEELQFIDVRNTEEIKPTDSLKGLSIPLNCLPGRLQSIEKEKPVVLYCQTGIRSKRALAQLNQEYGFKNIMSLRGGLLSWENQPIN